MTDVAYKEVGAPVTNVGARGLISRLVAAIKRRRELKKAEEHLYGMDDRLLLDIGISRGDIHRMVWGEPEQRR